MKLELYNCQDAESPCDWDETWKVVSFNSRHVNSGDPYDYISHVTDDGDIVPINIGLRSKLEAGTAFFLSYYEHGLCQWSLKNEGQQCRWDSTSLARILLWETDPSGLGAKTYEERQADARVFLETYTCWCNGEVYGFTLSYDNGTLVDSCGGFFGNDLETMFAEHIRPHTDSIKDEKHIHISGDAACIADTLLRKVS